MLVDVKFDVTDHVKLAVMAVIDGGTEVPIKLDTGFYLSKTLNFEHRTSSTVDHFPDDFIYQPEFSKASVLPPCSYGVCDSPEEFMQQFKYGLAKHSNKFCVSFVAIRKADQPSCWGWRWHKWGPYIGRHEPTQEYLYDEPNIDVVYVYTILGVVEV